MVDIGALDRWMDAQGHPGGSIDEVSALSDGTQNILLQFTWGGGSYVLRRPPLSLRANSNETMCREVRMLSVLAGAKVPHPKLIAASPREDVLGAAFYLMEPVAGFNATVGLPPLHTNSPAIRHRMGLSLVEAIAELSALDYRCLGLTDFGKPDGFLARQVERWRAQLESYSDCDGWAGAGRLPE
jgi:aminoglycoside phosphotransferase (APT) family kinase protein